MRPETASEAAASLEERLESIAMLTVHAVGIGENDTLIVYCRAKQHAERHIPKSHGCFAVKRVLCKVAPAGVTR